MTDTETTWTEFYCGRCHTEAAFFGDPPEDYEFTCECENEDE